MIHYQAMATLTNKSGKDHLPARTQTGTRQQRAKTTKRQASSAPSRSATQTPPLVATSAAAAASTKNQKTTGISKRHQELLKDEQANQDLNNKDIPDDLKNFLSKISYPTYDELMENEEKLKEENFKKALKEAKPRVDTRRNSKPIVHPDGSSDNETDEGFEAEAGDLNKELIQHIPLEKLIPERPSGKARFSKYELTLLWSELKNKFPNGKVNKRQLYQLLHQVFPKCEADSVEHVVDNIMIIFDHTGSGTIFFRDLLIAFSLSMKGPLQERLQWSYRLYDEEGKGEIDTYDLERIIVRLCEFTKSADVFLRRSNSGKKSKPKEDVAPPITSIRPLSPVKQEKPPTPSRKDLGKSMSNPTKSSNINDDLPGMKVMSSKMSERFEATKSVRKKQMEQQSKSFGGTESPDKPTKKEKDPHEEITVVIEANEEERQRALEVVKYLDADGDGFVSQDEFVQGCLDDEEFFGLASSFRGDLIWGDLLCDTS